MRGLVRHHPVIRALPKTAGAAMATATIGLNVLVFESLRGGSFLGVDRYGLFELLICNQRYEGDLLEGMGWVKLGENTVTNYPVYQADLNSDEEPWHHDETKLAKVLIDIYQDRTGPIY